MSFYCTREWFYDADTYTVIDYLKKQHLIANKRITLNTNWLFQPSFSFHARLQNQNWLGEPPYHKETQPDGSFEYYYATADEVPALAKTYEPVLWQGWHTRVLMKKK